MNIKKTILLAGAAAMLSVTACKKDDTGTDNNNPTPTAENVKLTMTVDPSDVKSFCTGDFVVFHTVATGNANNNLKSMILTAKITIGGSPLVVNDTVTLTGTSYDKYDTLVFEKGIYGATYEISAVLNGASGTPATAGPFTFTTNTLDKDQPELGNQTSSKAKFWSGKLKGTYFLADLKGDSNASKQAAMDFAYCTRSAANGGNKLISPSSDDATAIYADQWNAADEKITTWNPKNRNTTGFIKVNSKISFAQFNNTSIDTDSLIEMAKTVGEPSSPSVSVADGDIYLYRTVRGQGDKKAAFWGVIYVSSPTGAYNGSSTDPGSAQLIIRYQREN